MLLWADRATRPHKHLRDKDGDLLELYCGNGNFTLAIAHNFRYCIGTEISEELVATARENAETNNIKNAMFLRTPSSNLTRGLTEYGLQRLQKELRVRTGGWRLNFRTVLVDPPRDGLDLATRKALRLFQRIVYISCSPRTFARDMKNIVET